MTTEAVLPVEIVNVADGDDHPCEDDDVSVLYATPAVSRRRGIVSDDAIPVEEYIEDKDLRLSIMNALFLNRSASRSSGFSSRKKTSVIDLSGDVIYDVDIDDDILFCGSTKSRQHYRRWERGESSSSIARDIEEVAVTFTCEICVDLKPSGESFTIMGCSHKYCSDCIAKYVASKLQDNISQMQCPVPGCNGRLEPYQCRPILPREVFDRWGDALCEAMLLAEKRFYCPYKDCSGLLIEDNDGGNQEVTEIAESECPYCRRLFCSRCKVSWHSGISCSDFQTLHKDEREREDIMLMKLAKDKNWKRCPSCKFYVERSSGCLFMTCRCGYTFCYNCGAFLREHYCRVCKH